MPWVRCAFGNVFSSSYSSSCVFEEHPTCLYVQLNIRRQCLQSLECHNMTKIEVLLTSSKRLAVLRIPNVTSRPHLRFSIISSNTIVILGDAGKQINSKNRRR